MPTLHIAESETRGLILVSTKRWPFCVMSKIGHNSPALSWLINIIIFSMIRIIVSPNKQKHRSHTHCVTVEGGTVMCMVVS